MAISLDPVDPAMQAQWNEFAALKKLNRAFSWLPPIVDDSYPACRQVYEQELRNFIEALIANKRI
jgi:hypothetical protein